MTQTTGTDPWGTPATHALPDTGRATQGRHCTRVTFPLSAWGDSQSDFDDVIDLMVGDGVSVTYETTGGFLFSRTCVTLAATPAITERGQRNLDCLGRQVAG